MINQHLHISNEDCEIEMYLNKDGKIFIQDASEDTDDQFRAWLTIDVNDWTEIKKFIDKQFNSLK